MKKSLLIVFLLLIASITLTANGTSNPNDEIYSDIDRWNNLGLITNMPPIRPYPAQYLRFILSEVISKGSKSDADKAQKYLDFYTKTSITTILKNKTYSSLDEVQTFNGIGMDVSSDINQYISIGLDINAYLLNDVDKAVTAPNRNTGVSVNEDNMGFSAFGEYWNMYQSLNMNAAFGTENFWFQTGMMPTSFGPLFSDSVVMNPNAEQSAHFSYTWRAEKFTWSYLFMPIVATDSSGNNESDDKYIHIRSLDFNLLPWWEFQFYETAIYGGKGVKPIFFLPFSEFFYSASQGGTWDVNSLMGVSSKFKLPNNTTFTGTVYMDDIAAKDVATFKLDTRYKFAAQAELKWTPVKSFLKSADISYTAIMPYMYTHTTESDEDSVYYDIFDTDYDSRYYALSSYMNYENYTNAGVSMGPYGMGPNSDKISVNFNMEIPKGFTLKLHSEVRRHGNSSGSADREYYNTTVDLDGDGVISESDYTLAAEQSEPTCLENGMTVTDFFDAYDTDHNGIIDDAVDTDGTIFDDGYGWTTGYLYDHSTPFLSQDILEIAFINELTLITPQYDLFNGKAYGEAGYAFVYVMNEGLVDGEDNSYSYIRFALNYAF